MASNQPGPPGPTEGQGATNAEIWKQYQPKEQFGQQSSQQLDQQAPQFGQQQAPQFGQQQAPQFGQQQPPQFGQQQPPQSGQQPPPQFGQQDPQQFGQQQAPQFGQQQPQQFGQQEPQQFSQQQAPQFGQQPPPQFGQQQPPQFGQQPPPQFGQQPPPQFGQQQPQQFGQQQAPQFASPYAPKQLMVTVQMGAQQPVLLHLPCEVHEFFQWFFCLYDRRCLDSLKESLSAIGASLILLKNKAPMFRFSVDGTDITTHLQHYLKETSYTFDIRYEFFSWDLTISDVDAKEFYQKCQREEQLKGTLLLLERDNGRDGVCLVGTKAAFDASKPFIMAELQKLKSSIPFVENSLRNQISVGLRHLKLPNEFHTFLLKSEKAQLYIKTEIKWHYKLSIQFRKTEQDNKADLFLFEENNLNLGDVESIICKLLFFIPSQDALCQIFCTEDGKSSFSNIVKENEGKVSMILDGKGQACCVGTKDIEEKIKNSMKRALMMQKLIPFPSEEVYSFCKKHWDIQVIGKENSCGVHFVQGTKPPLALEIYGQEANVSSCQRKIENEIGKIATKPVQLVESSDGSAMNLIERWNKQKRCFASLRQGNVKKSFPWKKWIESRDSGGSLTYLVNFNSTQGGEAETLRIILLPEEQGGGRCIEMDVQGGQLAQQKDFDVLVNSTAYNLVLDSGFVSKSILKAAGPEIQEECKQKYKGGIYIGKLAITKGYGLQCKFVFHGCLTKYTAGDDFKSLRTMVRKCLETADEMNMESIAFPALGTGNLGYNRKDVANIIYEEVEKYEKVAIAGSLCRVCCVIFQDDVDTVTEFQKRQLQWMESHKSERSQEEVVVTTDDPQVFRDICLEVQQFQSTKVKEPPKSEISESERLGESPGKRDVGGDSNSKQFKKSSKKFEPLSDERRCLVLRTKENSKKDSLVESEVKKDFENLTENIVCPFHDPKQALLQFSSARGAEEMLQNEKMKKKYDLQQFPSQAVVDLKAVVSQKMVQLMVKKGVTAHIIRKNSGVIVEQKDPQSMVLSGNILEIKAAFDFLSTLLKKQEMEPKELNTDQRNEHLNTEVDNSTEKILPETENSILQKSGAREFPKEQADILPEHLQHFGTSNKTLSQVSFTPSMTMSTPSQGYQGQQPKNSAEAMPPKPQQPSPHEDKRMICTPDDLYQLQYFHGSILENAEKKWNTKKTRVDLIFVQHGIKEEVGDMLKKIEQMHRKTVEVAKTFKSLETFIQQKCSQDLLCYITDDEKKIVIIGIDKRKVEKIEKECKDLLASETEMEVKSEESASTLPVFVTNEGISVFVYCDSLLKADVDAVLCPISKSFDLRGGLPKIIADMAGASYRKNVNKILEKNGKLPEQFVCSISGIENLICKYVVNAVTTAYATYEPEESKKYLQHLLIQSFVEAEKVGAKSIALTAICSGKMAYPKEVCVNCYASSVVIYSRGIKNEKQGLREIHFVDQSPEMITFIESVFSNPDMMEMVDFKEQIFTADSSLYPYVEKTGICWLNEYLKVRVANTAISKLDSSPIATLVYSDCLKLEKSVLETILSKLKGSKSKSKSHNTRQVGYIEIHHQEDPSKRFINIMHVVLPTLSNKNDLDSFCTELSLCYANIFQKAMDENLIDLILPLYGAEKGNDEVTRRSASCLLNEVRKFGEKLLALKRAFSILIANGEKPVHDIILKELEVLVESEQAGFSLSGSFRRKNKPKQMSTIPMGDQPKGSIQREKKRKSLKGFEYCDTIELHVRIPDGIQQHYHPNEGERFIGRKETIYIPDNTMGVKVAKKLIAAFNSKILYTVKTNTTTKVEMVQHTDIPLKTSWNQYPDPGYLKKVLKVLDSKIKS